MKQFVFLIFLFVSAIACAQQRDVRAYVVDEQMKVDSLGTIVAVRLSVVIDTVMMNGRYFTAQRDTTITNRGAITILTGDNPVPKNNLYRRILQSAGGRALKALRRQIENAPPLPRIASDKKKDSLGTLIDIRAIRDSSLIMNIEVRVK
mgnify:CR=1 FL=1